METVSGQVNGERVQPPLCDLAECEHLKSDVPMHEAIGCICSSLCIYSINYIRTERKNKHITTSVLQVPVSHYSFLSLLTACITFVLCSAFTLTMSAV